MAETRLIPVAVIGMSCRLPGGIDSPEQLWDALLRGDDFITEVPLERWDAEEYYDPEPGVPGRSVSKWGGFLDDVGGFDSEFFGMAEREATAIDPQHRLLLETSWEAVEHAGLNPASISGSRTGVFMGLTHNDYAYLAADARALEGPYGFTGTNFSLASGRIAYTLGVHGPAMTVDTACSSSLFAVHMACRSLHENESNLALAGGVSLTMEPRKSPSASAQGMLSPTGRCHAFDVGADGFVASEACAVVLLKRLPDALRDGDRVLAVIRGTASNQDGRTVNIATPSQEAQVAAYREALDVGAVDPATVGMVEAHGTGTPVGDPIEFASLAQVYGGEVPCALASVKTNFGHTQSASGALGLIKAVLALRHGVVPQNLHFTRLPEELAQIDTKLFVPQEPTPWPTNGHHPRRAAVSSYGLSGTNVHVVLEQAPAQHVDDTVAGPGMTPPLLFPLSSTSADELRRTAGRLAAWVAEHDDTELALSDLAYTLARRRGHRPVRAAVTARSTAELIARLHEVATGDTPYLPAAGQDDRGPVWVFSGQGSQWAGMGTRLLAAEPAFAAAVAEMEPLIAREAGFSVTEAMTAAETVTGIDRVQPTIFAMQVALAATMRSYGVQPGAVIGHSLGEAAASVVAGGLSLEDGVRVICRRSRLMTRIAGAGAMASVELPATQVLSELAARGIADVSLSVVASPNSTVIGGATETVRRLVAEWEEREIMAREVAVDVASHSDQVDPILDDLEYALTDLQPLDPTVPYFSATLYDPRDTPLFDADYWVENLRHTVRFAAAVEAALEDGYRVFAELAPHPLLTHAVDQTARSLDMTMAALAAMRRDQADIGAEATSAMPHGLRGFLEDLYCAGAAVDFSVLYPDGRLVDPPLPTWTRRQLLLSRDGQESQSNHGAFTVSVHPLLGSYVRLQEEPERHAWQADVGTAVLPWLADHQIHNVAALPGAAYCEMALAAARTVLGEACEIRDIRFEQMLLLDDHTEIGSAASAEPGAVYKFIVETGHDGERARRASAMLHAASENEKPPAHDMAVLLAEHATRLAGDEMREWFASRGIQFGPAFTGLASAHTGDDQVETVLAEIGLPGAIRSQHSTYGVHPALLDACFQSVAAHPAVQNASAGGMLLPLGVRALRAYGPARNARYCLTQVRATDAGAEADIDVMDEYGTVLLTVRGLEMGSGASEVSERDRLFNDRLLTIEWRQKELPAPGRAAGPWLLVSTSDTTDLLATKLTDALKLNKADVTAMSWPYHADHGANAEVLRSQLGATEFSGLVVVMSPKNGNPDDEFAVRGRQYVDHLVRILRGLPEIADDPPRLFVVTRKARTVLPTDVPNLEQAGLRGLLRVVDAEHPHLRTTQIDVDDETEAQHVAQHLLSGSEEDETAWRAGEWFTARLCPAPLRPEERRTTEVSCEHDGMRLKIRTPGDIESLELTWFDRVAPGPGQIEVAVTASSINFADVLVAFGRYPTFEGYQQQLGIDFAGVVTAVGPGVMNHKVGDRVGGMSADGCWSTYITCDARLAVTLAPGLSDGVAAAIPTAHATAWYGLHDLGRISAGDKVLIHSATGGVGQAAIAIARAAGAEIFATAGSPQRRELLRDSGIEHIYDSRSTGFAEQIRADTDGYGVDIVLNSLPGVAQRAGLELLAFGGRFIEIGKRDIYGDARLGLLPFRRNLSFHAVDLALMTHSHPEKVKQLLQTVYMLTADGVLPTPQTTHYQLSEAGNAIRLVGAAQHIGKVVLDVPRTGHSGAVVPPEYARVFRGDGSYLITGGLGGLGLFLAEQMADAGCGRIVLSSRSEPNALAQRTIDRIRAAGTDVVVECGDISERDTADRLVAAATATGLPLRGVLHAAAVVDDATLTNITDELIDRDWAPKVFGAWNLHRATAAQPLDWFCSFSSAAALVGSPGQGAYAAANSWLDGFTHWRRAQGLPATAVAWGAWAEIGRAAALAEGADGVIRPEEGGYAFRALLSHDRPYSGYAPVLGSPWLTAFAQRSKFAEVFASMGQNRSETSKFRSELDVLPEEEWPTHIRRMISDQISLILRRSIDPDRPLSECGLDSLGSLELRTRIETETGVRITPTDITTVRGLAASIHDKLTGQETASAVS